MPSKHVIISFVTSILFIYSLIGCAEFYGKRQNRYTSSIVEYLYPEKEVAEIPAVPHLSLPRRVGVAFMPESG